MTETAQPLAGPVPAAQDTFCAYLASQFIAKRGFVPCTLAEASPLAGHCDRLLSYSDGYSLVLLCLVDREAHPYKTFDLAPEAVLAAGADCLKHTGRLYGNKMPVTILIVEVGAQEAGQSERLSHYKASGIFSKVQPSAWIVDPLAKTLWTNALFGKISPHARFARKMMRAPREQASALAVPAVAAELNLGFPYLTAAIIAVLCVLFIAEIAYGVGPWTGLMQPSIATLIAFGGLYRPLVLESGEWTRLFSAPLLHVGLEHIALNGIALYLGGRILEGLVGRAWLAAIFVVGALCGSLLSLALNGDNLVSVGASGAVMALFAALLVLAFHFSPGAERTALLTTAIYVLIPSLIPLASSFGGKVDYAAHFGGALGGVAMGLLLLALWQEDAKRPRLAPAAGAVGLAGLLAFAYAFTPLPHNHRKGVFSAALIPSSDFPKTDAEAHSRAADLVAKYPRDPRSHYFQALAFWDANDTAAAERALRAGLAEEELWRDVMIPEIRIRLRGALAVLLATQNRRDEARAVARPACELQSSGSTRKLLDENKLCAP